MVTIGIDFGTSNIRTAVYTQRGLEILKDASGEKQCPTFVVLQKDEEPTYGEEARSLSTIDTLSTVFDAKSFIGLDQTEAEMLAATQRYPFKIETDSSNGFKFDISMGVSPTSSVQLLLEQARQQSMNNLGGTIENCVISVPWYWRSQKTALVTEAAHLAGFKEVYLIDNQVAAVMGCFIHTLDSKSFSKNVIVVDVGATGINATAFRTFENGLSRRSRLRISQSSGNALDLALMRNFGLTLQRARGFNISDLNILHRLRLECQDAKIRMSTMKTTSISLKNLPDGSDFEARLNKDAFDAISRWYADKVVFVINEILQKASLSNNDDYQILLVGGASRLPAIRRNVKDQFGEHVNPSVLLYSEEASVFGAAVLSQMLEMVPDLKHVRLAKYYRPLCEIFQSQADSNEVKEALASYVSKLPMSKVETEVKPQILDQPSNQTDT